MHTTSSLDSLIAEGGEPEVQVGKKPSEQLVNTSGNEIIIPSDNGSAEADEEPVNEGQQPKKDSYNPN
jgi:hypothetical protein